MSGKDVCLVLGTAAVCWMFGYYWNKRRTGLTTSLASLSQSDSTSRTSVQLIPGNSEENTRLNGNDVEEDRGPVGEQWFDAVLLHASEDEIAARRCQKILLEQVNVPKLANPSRTGVPGVIISSGKPIARSRCLRQQDRHANKECYPALHYPEVYLLEGGYKVFYEQFSEYCDPISYKPMLHKDHQEDLRHFRIMSKSWAGEKTNRPGFRPLKF